MCGLTGWCQVNNEAISNIHSPVLIGSPEDFYQVPRLWFLIILGLEQRENKTVCNRTEFSNNCSTFDLTRLT